MPIAPNNTASSPVFDSGLFPQPDGPPLLPSLHPKGRPELFHERVSLLRPPVRSSNVGVCFNHEAAASEG